MMKAWTPLTVVGIDSDLSTIVDLLQLSTPHVQFLVSAEDGSVALGKDAFALCSVSL